MKQILFSVLIAIFSHVVHELKPSQACAQISNGAFLPNNGMLPTRVATRSALPTTSTLNMLLYVVDEKSYYVYDGASWVKIGAYDSSVSTSARSITQSMIDGWNAKLSVSDTMALLMSKPAALAAIASMTDTMNHRVPNGRSLTINGSTQNLSNDRSWSVGTVTPNSSDNFTNKTGNISQWSNDAGYLTGITPLMISGALGYTPYNASNPSGFISGYTETDPLFNSKFAGKTTDSLAEGSKLYFTPSRARASISSGSGLSYNSSTGVMINSLPDQTIVLNAGTGISTSGTYPSFTVTNTAPDQSVALSAGTGISVSGTYPSYSITNSAPDKTVTITSGTGINATGAYPGFTITNTAPDQTVTLTAGSNISITGTYPNFTISANFTPTISYPARSVNVNFTPSSTKATIATYTLTCTSTNPLLAGASLANVFLEYSTNGGTVWQSVSQMGNSNSVGLAVTIQLTNGQTASVSGIIPANALTRIRTATTGTASISIVSSQEVTF